ncbi:hypothetical protein SEA_KABOCHA_89 [Gordonia phage Kabocha]|uniref:Uncharacterized protein n=1 Tax=Gordonia phage Chidiebere TaxID=2656530 RepID=A0A649VKW1_9CAUD|nr:hypothetical protein PQD14_gp088 [Gordonia phage Chidiebere]AZS07941.1 hypothetical protein PBI_GRAY_88 [Gordonia phage Gray]WAA19875.1 hypothetical protein SEA_KABOCHA_89 [Gordonia phage Kabocha]WAA20064.1 hypothetical protein SEA_HANEM_87 [Gordonia phage Hanem]WNM67107.1 hypothetical protein SEA_SCHOMBER_86 [Gordonia Phage Schomber]QGJ92978.1 hypothetical protein PBI_CHIDIEBERE_88 [Gordonia phage Chidiebere]
MLIMCARGCGYPIDVPIETMQEAQKAGQPVNVSHPAGQCPGQSDVPRYKYRLRVTVDRFPNVPGEPDEVVNLIGSGATVEADTLSDAFDPLTDKFTEQWKRVQEMRFIAEQTVEGEDTPTEQG